MSTMVISSTKTLSKIVKKLEDRGVKNIYFYCTERNDSLTAPMMVLLSYVDVVIIGNDTDRSPQVKQLIKHAGAVHVPVISEDFKKLGAKNNGKDTYATQI